MVLVSRHSFADEIIIGYSTFGKSFCGVVPHKQKGPATNRPSPQRSNKMSVSSIAPAPGKQAQREAALAIEYYTAVLAAYKAKGTRELTQDDRMVCATLTCGLLAMPCQI